jgi:hypothetical protein
MADFFFERAKNPHRKFTRKSISLQRDRIQVYKGFFNWPALFASLESDINQMEKIIQEREQKKSKDCSQEKPRKKTSGKNKNGQ